MDQLASNIPLNFRNDTFSVTINTANEKIYSNEPVTEKEPPSKTTSIMWREWKGE